MTKLARCQTCGGFRTQARCPHCRATSATTLLVGGAIAFTLMACYGGPPPHEPAFPETADGGGADMPVAK